MIPTKFLAKLSPYEINSHGVPIKVSVINRGALIHGAVSELRSQFGRKVVGPIIQHTAQDYRPTALLLCVGTCCLMLHLYALHCTLDDLHSVRSFLADPEVCFVGVGLSEGVKKLDESLRVKLFDLNCSRGVELGDLAARVLKKSKLAGCRLEELASEVGIRVDEPLSGVNMDWEDKIFSHEQIKVAIRDVHLCYLIGNRLLDLL